MLRRILGMARGAARGGPAARPGPRPGLKQRRRSMSPGRMGPGRMSPGPAGARGTTGSSEVEHGVRSIVRGVSRRRRGL